LLADHPDHFREASQFMGRVKSGEGEAFIPEGVLIECVYVLLKFYKVPRNEIATKLETMLNYKGIINKNLSILTQGLRLFRDKNVDIVDALVHSIAAENNWPVFTFDRDLRKLGK
ncbi:MAG: PIN domain-containing protein, partial [Desulfobacterota bacterium]|nr:PIN domain-containing protein [Thermodesulfobacteriota bacterium]